MGRQKGAKTKVLAMAAGEALSPVAVRHWGTRLIATLLCLGGALLLTASRIETTRLRYDLNELLQSRLELKTEVERMQLEKANLTRPQRIERLAKSRGLIYPRTDQVIGMNE